MGGWDRGIGTLKLKFAPVEQFPLDLFTGFQADGGGQCQREAHVEPWVLSARTDGLDAQWEGCLHFFRFDC